MAIDIEEVFPLLFAAQPNIVGLISTRAFPNRLPERLTFPCVIFKRLAGSPVRTLDGKSSVRWATFQVESWSDSSQQEARQLDGYVQAIECGAVSVGGWWIQKLTVNQGTDQDNPQIPIHADDIGLFCSFSEFTVFYKLDG